MSEYLDWKVGDRVEFIGFPIGFDRFIQKEILPVIGSVYSIRELFLLRNKVQVRLNEIVNSKKSYTDALDGCECAFIAYAFRKLIDRPTDISIFKDMLTKTPEQNNKELVESELEELVNV